MVSEFTLGVLTERVAKRKTGGPIIREDKGMYRHPLWIGEVDLIRAIFGHAASADPDRLLRIAPQHLLGRVTRLVLEHRLGRRRLDVLVSAHDEDGDGQRSRWLVVEAKVGAVVDPDTLTEYLASVRAQYGPTAGLVVSPYQPIGCLPSGWDYQDLKDVAEQLSCPPMDDAPPCAVCEEIRYAVGEATSTALVTEWRTLAHTTRNTALPDDWVMAGTGSSVGRPLVRFMSPRLDENEDSFVQVSAGNIYGRPTALVMLVALAGNRRDRVVFPDRFWRVLARSAEVAPTLPADVTDRSSRGRGARDPEAANGASRNGVPPKWSLGYNMKGWHGRGRELQHVTGDYSALLPAAMKQGQALYSTARQALRGCGSL